MTYTLPDDFVEVLLDAKVIPTKDTSLDNMISSGTLDIGMAACTLFYGCPLVYRPVFRDMCDLCPLSSSQPARDSLTNFYNLLSNKQFLDLLKIRLAADNTEVVHDIDTKFWVAYQRAMGVYNTLTDKENTP